MGLLETGLALYLGIGVLIAMVGGVFRQRENPRPRVVVTVQFLFLTILWLPALMYNAATGVEARPIE